MSTDSSKAFTPFNGAGELANLCRHYDWSSTVLGSPASWPDALKTVLTLCLDSHFPIAVWWGPELIQFYNDAYRPILGATKHPIALGAAAKNTWPEIWPTIGPMVDKVILSGETVKGEDMPLYLERNGYSELCFFTFSYSPIRDLDGNPVGMFTAAVETTTQVLAERRQAFQIQLYDRIRGLVDPNEITDSACKLLGLHMQASRVGYSNINNTVQELHVAQCWTDGSLETAKGLDLQLDFIGKTVVEELRGGKTVALEDINSDERCSDAITTYFQLGVSAMLLVPIIRNGTLRSILSVGEIKKRRWRREEIQLVEDVAGRIGATVEKVIPEFSLRKKIISDRDQLSSLLNNAPSFMALLMGPEHIFEMTNRAYQKLIGDRQVIGKTVRQALPEAEEQGFIAKLDEVFCSGEIYSAKEAEVILRTNSGQPDDTRYLDFIYQPVTDSDNTIIGVFVEGFDVTDRKLATDGLKEASRRKDEFLAMLAHELRNPLAPISAASALLHRTELDAAGLKRTSEIISRQVSHMKGLIDDLLDVSRVTRGLIVLEKASQNLKEIIASAIEQARPLMEAKHHHFSVHLASDDVHILGDQKRLIQILTNLLNNAVKYTPNGGNIELRLETSPTMAIVKVIDNGIGISANMHANMFELFAQAERTSDRTQGGLGLGLALVKNLTELHDGTASYYSAGLGQGSTFTVCLPRTELISQREIATNGITILSASKSLQIMIVDDNEDASEVLAMFLREIGHQVSVESSSRRVLESASLETMQVMILDIGMPEIDGLQLASIIRSKKGTSKKLLIALTGYGSDQDRLNSTEAGFDHHLVKPISPSALVDVLENFSAKR
jgi:signal transduction histidine kinase/CheY-like chemotaxis protein